MTDPSQYFKGRTVQEQMDEVIGYVDVRSAEVATAAIASDVAQVHQDMLDADADASAAAASAAAAAGTLANAVKKTGESSQTVQGDLVVVGKITGGKVTVPAPTNDSDAANKKYVDDQDALDAKLAGATFTGQLNATGQRAYDPSNVNDVATISTLDAYTPMVRTTGNQGKSGNMTFYDLVKLEGDSQYLTQLLLINKKIEKTDRTQRQESSIYFQGKDNQNVAAIVYAKYPNGEKHLIARLFDDSGGYHDTDLASWSGDI